MSGSNINSSHLLNVQVYCHACALITVGRWHVQNSEYSCNICNNNFVEELGQDHEQFTSSRSGTSVDSSRSSSDSYDDESVLTSLNTITNSIPYSHRSLDRMISLPSLTTAGAHTEVDTAAILPFFLNRSSGNTPTHTLYSLGRSSGDGPVGIVLRQGPSNQQADMQAPTADLETNANNQQTRDILSLVQSLLSGSSSSVGGDDMSATQLDQLLHHILMHESSHSGTPPASKRIIDSLTRTSIMPDTDTSLLGRVLDVFPALRE